MYVASASGSIPFLPKENMALHVGYADYCSLNIEALLMEFNNGGHRFVGEI